ncbi:MAG: Gfo/Idh/MocA family oxidoreductase [Vicinamibacteria bacterium]|jgi:predicted dehydrogenase|nr:Gfo/Idh/MocA family oxidoreductase [Vicinamibacteria bacterium]
MSLRLALLGCGYAARLHASALKPTGGAVTLSAASREPARAEAFAREWGTGTLPSYEAAIASPEVDAVVVLTPPDSHLELTLAALAAGKHVIVEKPAFPRAADFGPVAAAAAKAGRQVMVAENYYYKPLAVTLRGLLREGAIGEPRFVFVNAMKEQQVSGWRQDPAVGGGALYEGGIHWVSLMAGLGLTVKRARGAFPAHGDRPERAALATFEYEEGAVGALAHSWEQPSPLKGLRLSRIFGREGSIAFESNGLFVLVWGRKKRLLVPGGLRDLTGRGAMWRDFLSAIATGRAPEMDLSRARRDLELVEEIGAAPAGA